MRQIVYASLSAPEDSAADLTGILEQSRHNNALDGVTGLLWSDGRRFLQVLEGPEESVGPTFERIRRDPRHHAVDLLSDRHVKDREFGYWSMAFRRPDEPADDFDARLRQQLERMPEPVRGLLDSLIAR